MSKRNPYKIEDSERITFRCSKENLADYEALAATVEMGWRIGVPLSKWIRRVLNFEVARVQSEAAKKAEKAIVGQVAGVTSDKPKRKRKGAKHVADK